MEESIYFKPGDIVRLKQDVPNVPQMIVVKKETLLFKSKDEEKKNGLKGIKCMWFTSDGAYQEHTFNTKDLLLIQKDRKD